MDLSRGLSGGDPFHRTHPRDLPGDYLQTKPPSGLDRGLIHGTPSKELLHGPFHGNPFGKPRLNTPW